MLGAASKCARNANSQPRPTLKRPRGFDALGVARQRIRKQAPLVEHIPLGDMPIRPQERVRDGKLELDLRGRWHSDGGFRRRATKTQDGYEQTNK